MATFADAGTTAGPRYAKVAIWLHRPIGLANMADIGFAMLTEEAHRAARGVRKTLVVMNRLAAFRHQFVGRDGLLSRMDPF